MRTNYVLIDFENLQPELLPALDLEHFRVLVFVGANQAKVPVAFAAALQQLGSRAQYIQISGSGHNALDFHITFYMGELSMKEPGAFFHLVTGDRGFEPLLKHLKDRGVFARQWKSIGDIPHIKAASSKTLAEKVAVVVGNFKDRKSGKPTTVRTLRSSIEAMFPHGLAAEELDDVINTLQSQSVISVTGTKVTHPPLHERQSPH